MTSRRVVGGSPCCSIAGVTLEDVSKDIGRRIVVAKDCAHHADPAASLDQVGVGQDGSKVLLGLSHTIQAVVSSAPEEPAQAVSGGPS